MNDILYVVVVYAIIGASVGGFILATVARARHLHRELARYGEQADKEPHHHKSGGTKL